MIKELKEIRRQKLLENNRELVIDQDGRVIVDLNIRNDDCFLSAYSTESCSMLSSDVSDFIEHSLLSIPPNERIKLRVHSNVITSSESIEYTDAIHAHYSVKYKNVVSEKSKLLKTALIMAIISVIALSIMIYLSVTGIKMAVVSEVIDIFAWVFMWEAVDITFLQCTILRRNERRYLCLIDSVVEYFVD